MFHAQKVSSEVRPLWFVFSGLGSQWPCMGRDLMTLDCFRESIMRSDALLRPHGVHLLDLLMTSEDDAFDGCVNTMVGIAAIQVSFRHTKNVSVPCAEFPTLCFTCLDFSRITLIYTSI